MIFRHTQASQDINWVKAWTSEMQNTLSSELVLPGSMTVNLKFENAILPFIQQLGSPTPFPLQNGWARALYKPNFLLILGVGLQT